MRRLASLALACLLAGCRSADDGAPDELTIVVQGDRRELDRQEKALREREEALRTDKAQLESRISDLSQNLKAAADAEQRRNLEAQLRNEQDRQAQVVARQTALDAQKTEIEQLRQAGGDGGQRLALATLGARDAQTVAREARAAEREALLGQRERELAAREKELAAREKAVAALEHLGPQQPGAAALGPREVPQAAAVDQSHKKLLKDLEQRGLLISDLPADQQPLNAEIWAARKQGDLVRAADLISELARGIDRFKVDQKFVEAKMQRLQSARGGVRLRDPQRKEVERLLRDVTSAYSDGRYELANKALNRIAVILDAGAPAG